jgi:hypothetical protein
MLSSIRGYLRNLCLGDFVREHTAHTFTASMHFEHDARCRGAVQIEDALKNVNNKLHRSVVVIQENNLIQRRSFQSRLGLFYNQSAIVMRALFTHGHAQGLRMSFIGPKATQDKAESDNFDNPSKTLPFVAELNHHLSKVVLSPYHARHCR